MDAMLKHVFLLFIPVFGMSQDKLEFEILFGSYMNDHVKKEFHVQERNWKLKADNLCYSIDAHGGLYVDTIELKNDEIQALIDFMKGTEFNDSIAKDLSVGYLNKLEWELIIKGQILFDDRKIEFKIAANSPSILDEDLDAIKIKGIEDLLYDILSKRNKKN